MALFALHLRFTFRYISSLFSPNRRENGPFLSPGQTRARVDESWNSRSHLARNSHPLLATLIESRELSSNSNLVKFLMKVAENFVSFGRARVLRSAVRFYCPAGSEKKGKNKKDGVGFEGQREGWIHWLVSCHIYVSKNFPRVIPRVSLFCLCVKLSTNSCQLSFSFGQLSIDSHEPSRVSTFVNCHQLLLFVWLGLFSFVDELSTSWQIFNFLDQYWRRSCNLIPGQLVCVSKWDVLE